MKKTGKKNLIYFFIGILSVSCLHLNAQSSQSSKLSDEISLSEDDISVFKEKSQRKINEFTDYIVIIADKTQPASKRDLAEREALKLFHKDAIMEASIIKSDGSVSIKQRPMAEYLYRLKTLPYLRVDIKFYDICYVTDFIRAEDGSYRATATIFQDFTGYSGDKIIYHDITKKEIQIIINLVEDDFFNEKSWQVFLGDVKVAETKLK